MSGWLRVAIHGSNFPSAVHQLVMSRISAVVTTMIDDRNYENLKECELRSLLELRMPELSKKADEFWSSWDTMEPPVEMYYAHVFTPLLESLLGGEGDARLRDRAVALVEDLATSTDPTVQDMVKVSVLEPVLKDILIAPALRKLAGPNTRRVIRRMRM